MGGNKWFLLSLWALFLGVGSFFAVCFDQSSFTISTDIDLLPQEIIDPAINHMDTTLAQTGGSLGLFQEAVAAQADADKAISDQLAALAEQSKNNKNLEIIRDFLKKLSWKKRGYFFRPNHQDFFVHHQLAIHSYLPQRFFYLFRMGQYEFQKQMESIAPTIVILRL